MTREGAYRLGDPMLAQLLRREFSVRHVPRARRCGDSFARWTARNFSARQKWHSVSLGSASFGQSRLAQSRESKSQGR